MTTNGQLPGPAPDRRRLTIHYGDREGATVDNDRTGLPDDCPCPAVRWCGRPPHIQWPEPDCPHHGSAVYRHRA